MGATVAAPQEATELVNSAGLFPPAEIFEMCMGSVPVLVMATLMGMLARPWVVSGKVTEVGKNLSAGPFAEFIPVRKGDGLRAAGGIVAEDECGLTHADGRRCERFVGGARSTGHRCRYSRVR
jgi:hypothetical protein